MDKINTSENITTLLKIEVGDNFYYLDNSLRYLKAKLTEYLLNKTNYTESDIEIIKILFENNDI